MLDYPHYFQEDMPLTFIQHAYAKPFKLDPVKNASAGQVIIAFLFLLLLIFAPIAIQVFSYMDSQSQALDDIQAKVPDFEIQNGQMQLAEDRGSFLYQTDDVLFVFDPHGEMTLETLLENLDRLDIIAVGGFLQDRLYVLTPVNQVSLPYTAVEGLDQSILSDQFFTSFTWMLLASMLFLIVFYIIFISLMATLLAKFITLANHRPYTFGQLWKIGLAAAIWPTTLWAILSLLNIYSFILIFILRLAPFALTVYSTLSTDPHP